MIYGNFGLTLIRYGRFQGWEARANFLPKEFRYKDVPKGYYRLPSVVDNMPVISFRECFKDVTKGIEINTLDLTDVDFSNALTLHGMALDVWAKYIKINWKTVQVVENMDWMFSGCTILESIDMSGAGLVGVKSLKGVFLRCRRLEKIKLPAVFMRSLRDLPSFVNGCLRLRELDLSPIECNRLSDLESLCEDCKELRTVKLPNCTRFSLETEGTDRMFRNCHNLEEIICYAKYSTDLNWGDTIRAIDETFLRCDKLRYADLRFIGSIDLGETGLSNREMIIHCINSCKVPKECEVIDSGKSEDEENRVIKRMRALGNTKAIVIKHENKLG